MVSNQSSFILVKSSSFNSILLKEQNSINFDKEPVHCTFDGTGYEFSFWPKVNPSQYLSQCQSSAQMIIDLLFRQIDFYRSGQKQV